MRIGRSTPYIRWTAGMIADVDGEIGDDRVWSTLVTCPSWTFMLRQGPLDLILSRQHRQMMVGPVL